MFWIGNSGRIQDMEFPGAQANDHKICPNICNFLGIDIFIGKTQKYPTFLEFGHDMIFSGKSNEDDTIVEMLASALRRDISFGNLLPDQKLKIEALRQRYGGSNHSMRETLRLLSAEGLVEATAQRGFRVTSATEEDLKDIILVRRELEKTALSLAIQYGDIAWEGRVIAAHHALRKAEDQVAESPDDFTALQWDEACRAFSFAMIEACGSPRMIDLQRKFFDQSRRFRLALLREGRIDFSQRKVRQQQLLDATLARDAETAIETLIEDIEADINSAYKPSPKLN